MISPLHFSLSLTAPRKWLIKFCFTRRNGEPQTYPPIFIWTLVRGWKKICSNLDLTQPALFFIVLCELWSFSVWILCKFFNYTDPPPPHTHTFLFLFCAFCVTNNTDSLPPIIYISYKKFNLYNPPTPPHLLSAFCIIEFFSIIIILASPFPLLISVFCQRISSTIPPPPPQASFNNLCPQKIAH